MLPNDMPNDRTMTSLGWLVHAEDVVDDRGGFLCTLPAGGTWLVGNWELYDLQKKQWIDLQVDGRVTVTERGVYWYNKWLRAKARPAFNGYGPLAHGQSGVKLKMGPDGSLVLKAGGIEVTRG